MNHYPVAITPEKLRSASHLSTETKLWVGGFLGYVESGQTWLATDGQRTVLVANSAMVVYLLSGSKKLQNHMLYAQSAEGFRGEVTTYPFIEGARRAQKIARLAELEANIIMGMFSVSSGGALALVLGLDALDLCVKHQASVSKLGAGIKALLTTRTVLKRHAPTLWDKIFWGALLSAAQVTWDSLGSIPEAAANDPKVIGRLLGAILGKLGQKALVERAGAVRTILQAVLIPTVTKALGVIPAAVQTTVTEHADDPRYIIDTLRKTGVTITEEDARQILRELKAKPTEIRGSLEELRRAFAGVTAR